MNIEFTITIIYFFLAMIAPLILPIFRLNLLGRYLSLSIVALGLSLQFYIGGMLSLGQGIFFALGGYCIAMYLQLNSSSAFPNGIPEFFGLYGVDKLPFFWKPFKSPIFTLISIFLIPGIFSLLLFYLFLRNKIQGVYLAILTQATLLVFFNFFNRKQKLINGTKGLKTDVTQLFGQMVGSESMQRYFFWITTLLVYICFKVCTFFTSLENLEFFNLFIKKSAFINDIYLIDLSGNNFLKNRLIINFISGCLGGISGAHTVQSGIVSPQFMTVPFSIEMVIWMHLGTSFVLFISNILIKKFNKNLKKFNFKS